MAESAATWQRLLVAAHAKADEFGREAGSIMNSMRVAGSGFDLASAMRTARATMPTTETIEALAADVGNQGTLKRKAAEISGRVAGAAPTSNVTKDVVTLAMGVGNELTAAEQLLEMARIERDQIELLIEQILNKTQRANNLTELSRKKVALAYAGMVNIGIRIDRAISGIGGV